MQVLDADRARLTDRSGRKALRDTVQYVEFSKHRGDGVALATELLAELPGQFLEWVKLNKIPLPGPPLAVPPVQPSAPSAPPM